MTDPNDRTLEERLRSLTTWDEPAPELWRQALAQKSSDATGTTTSRFLNTPLPRWIVGAAALITIVVMLQLMLVPSLGRARDQAAPSRVPAGQAVTPMAPAPPFSADGAWSDTWYSYNPAVGVTSIDGLGGNATDPTVTISPTLLDLDEIDEGSSEPRQVVRKATIELVSDDVRAAYLKAALLVSAVNGEYIEASSISGDGDAMQAHVTVRVAAGRLSIVLNQLRELGVVRSEQKTGEDITTQVIDLEARLRNERAVEKELLELLASREDADLGDVLRLRQQLGSVRQQIEQLVARRAYLDRAVSLATILVLIRAAEPPEVETPAESGLGAYFGETIERAWTGGLHFLADTVALLCRLFIGGVIWWGLLIVVFIAVRMHRRRTRLSEA